MRSFGAVFVVLAFAWLLQLLLSLLQTRRFHRRIARLRRPDTATAVGMAGSNWKRKTYAVIVVDRDRTIVTAEKMSGFTVFANLQPVPAVVGIPLERLDGDRVEGVSAKLWAAFRNAAAYIRRHDENEADDDESDGAGTTDDPPVQVGDAGPTT